MLFNPFTRALYGHPSARFLPVDGRPWAYVKDQTNVTIAAGPTTLCSPKQLTIPPVGQVFLLPVRMYPYCDAGMAYFDIGIRVDGTDYFVTGLSWDVSGSFQPVYMSGAGQYAKIGIDMATWGFTSYGYGFNLNRVQYFDTKHLGLPVGLHTVQPALRCASGSGQVTYNGATIPTVFMIGSIEES